MSMVGPTHFNGLTPAEAERLAIFIEECGEAIQEACKILRHGYESRNPNDGVGGDGHYTGPSNQESLEREMGDVRAAMLMLCDSGDTNKASVHWRANEKLLTVRQWMHHREESQS